MHKIAELKEIKQELECFEQQSKFSRSKNLLNAEITKINDEIRRLEATPANNENSQAKKTYVDIKEHGFDQSNQFVKIYIPFDATKLKEEDVELSVAADSFSLRIHGPDRDSQFVVNSLLKSIDPAKSYRKVKPDMITIYLKKSKDNDTWECLTKTEKHLKDKKTKMFDKDENMDSSDPTAGLMNIMKKMYESGDDEMKRTISKAWVEGQEKNRNNNPF